MKKCVLLQHGLSVNFGSNVGVCCYNRRHPSTYSDYNIDQGCKTCIDQENNGIKSYREGANELYGLDHAHRSPIVLDITPNFNCNLSCKICTEHSSSSWAKIKSIKFPAGYNISHNKFETLFGDVDLSKVKEINFSGGEPLLTNNMIKYIGSLSDRIDFSNCKLRFSTNGTQQLTDKMSKFFLQFQLVLARFSLDDVEHGFEYQRYPAKWDTALKNWDSFLSNMPHNVIPSINRTVSILNLRRLHLLDAWHQQYQKTRFGDDIEIIDHFVFGPYMLSYLTPGLKESIQASGHSRAWEYVKNRSTTSNVNILRTHIMEHDKFHNTSLKEFDPDLYKFIFQ